MHPLRRIVDNDNIMSVRNNELLKDEDITGVYTSISQAQDIIGVCRLVNYCSSHDLYDGYADSEFFKVNFTSLLKHGTIEFRQHQGTTKTDRMIRWTEFVLKFIEYAIVSPAENVTMPGQKSEDLVKALETVGYHLTSV
ncbi:hypothetical protein J3459_006270 [Metarhizium acridum]|nr:hypothetical protein J3459_006270 [Metarhizium acridum]